MKVLVDAFNQDKALVGSFSVIVKTDGSFAALVLTKQHVPVLGHDLGPEAGHHLEAGAAAVLGRENSCRKMGLLDYVK